VRLVVLAEQGWVVHTKEMRELPKVCLVAAPLLMLSALGCEGSVDGPNDGPTQGGGGSSGNGGGGGSPSLAGGAPLPDGVAAQVLLPARIRRLTDAEYQASVTDLVGQEADGISKDFVPDSRQSDFTVNEAQRVDPVFARQLAEAADVLAGAVGTRATDKAPCANPSTGAAACAEQFIKSFGERAYRRPLAADEVSQLLTVFNTAFEGGTYEEGIALTVRAMLQSAAFLYLTEIGEAPATNVKLTAHELASSISYLVRGAPPTPELLARANSGGLDTPEGRYAAVTDESLGLFAGAQARDRVVRVVREWLGIDRIGDIAKDTNIYPDFAGAKRAIEEETTQFVAELVAQREGSLSQLIAGDWTMANATLGKIYGISVPSEAFQLTPTPNRLGILNQGAFLSVFAHAHETAPVLRGVAVLRRVACVPVPDPVELPTAVVPPPPDPAKTTRERFDIHSTEGLCAGCHDNIDNFGFAFEQFDGMGRYRTQDNNLPVVSSVTIKGGTDFDGAYANSNELVKAMSTSRQVQVCFARHAFRAMAGTSDAEFAPSEDDFVKYWTSSVAPEGSADVAIIETLRRYISSPAFAYRRAL
jgi:Protein of unknown function (DUF1588)/Protein of unknown function (DUF1592)/Protein of unknown function (DUF1595)/Protein of unknown function (DUF1587)